MMGICKSNDVISKVGQPVHSRRSVAARVHRTAGPRRAPGMVYYPADDVVDLALMVGILNVTCESRILA